MLIDNNIIINIQERKTMENEVTYIAIVPYQDEGEDETDDAASKGNVSIQGTLGIIQ